MKKVFKNKKTNQFIKYLYIRERVDIEYTTDPDEALEVYDDCEEDNQWALDELEIYQPNTFEIVEL